MLQQAFGKVKAIGLESELLAARYQCQDGHKRVVVEFNNQNLETVSVFNHVHPITAITRVRCLFWMIRSQRGGERETCPQLVAG